MKHAEFVHLHNHSDYSLLDGASPIPRMVKRAAELGMPSVALTDHGALFGVIEFYLEARKAGLKPILGMEAYVTRGKRTDRTRDTAHHLVLLARDATGFRNLVKLSSLAFLEGFYYRPRVDHEALAQHSAGLLALSACPKGEIGSDLLEDNEARAFETAMMYRDLFGPENFFLEVQNHGLDIEDKIRERVRALSGRTGIPVVATNDCHYLRHEDSGPHDVLLCIQTGKNVADTNRLRYMTDQVYFKSAEEMLSRFSDFPEALRNTLTVAERCNVELDFSKPLLPEFPLPPEWSSADEFLRHLTTLGLRERFGSEVSEEVQQRSDYEIDVICRMGFASYFLIVRDFIAFARSRGIGVGPGRGSVAGSLVAFALRITEINPLEHGLIFERFLNPERVTMPDIDIDFDDLRRGEVIEYVKQKYGEGSVTQIITFGTMGAKGVVRDVGRALGMAYAEVDKIAKMVPDGLGMTLERAFELVPELKSLGQRGPDFARLIGSARVLEGLARHASTHAAGVLITPGPLLDFVPLYRQKDDSITTQWDMNSIEKAGLLKMDFLGLRTLSVLDECVRLVKQHRGVELELSKLALDDAPAYKVFQDGDTVAIFQFESGGMRDYLKRLKPTVFGDLTAMNALYRPGPMENIPYFIDCKHGKQVARYDHPALEPILKDTYGVFVYQEQVMAAAHALAGFSMSQADELRRAMGKKLPAEMEKKRKQFVEGCGANKIQSKTAERIFATMEKFAGYGFNRSHSAAYALLAYQSSYLKAHYPAEFMAATLTSELSDSTRIATLVEECRRMKLELLPPDVNRSEWKFTLEDGKIRYGMGAVRNVGQAAVDSLLVARDTGTFRDMHDMARRLDGRAMNRRVLESLVAAGACDVLGDERGQLFAGAGPALDQAAALQRERESGQSSLFGEASHGAVTMAPPPLPLVPAWTPRERMSREKEALGFFLSEHPLTPLRDDLSKVSSHTIDRLGELPDGTEVRIAALVGEVRSLVTKAGRAMAAVMLEDLTGRIEATVFPDTYDASRERLQVDAIVVVSGRMESRDDRGVKLLAADVTPWEQARSAAWPTLHLEVRAEELSQVWLEDMDGILSSHPGECDVYLHIVMPDRSRQASRSRRYRVNQDDAVVRALVERFPTLRVRWSKGTS